VRFERAHRRGRGVSDADTRVVRRQAEADGLAEDVPPAQHIPLRTDRPAAEALDDLAAVLDGRLSLGGP
jgi:hypothetical protein